MRNCKGYMFVEMLAAYSVLLLIILTFLPFMMEGKAAKEQIIRKAEANYVLYEQLTAYMDGQLRAFPIEIERNNRKYELVWNENLHQLGFLEGCIYYEKNKTEKEAVCDFVRP